MGEMGWTLEKWKRSTFTEFNFAVDGYWRNYERNILHPMREVCYTLIAGNPNIKASLKPRSPQEYLKLSIDQEVKQDIPTKEEIEAARQRIFKNGVDFKSDR